MREAFLPVDLALGSRRRHAPERLLKTPRSCYTAPPCHREHQKKKSGVFSDATSAPTGAGNSTAAPTGAADSKRVIEGVKVQSREKFDAKLFTEELAKALNVSVLRRGIHYIRAPCGPPARPPDLPVFAPLYPCDYPAPLRPVLSSNSIVRPSAASLPGCSDPAPKKKAAIRPSAPRGCRRNATWAGRRIASKSPAPR